MKFSYIKRNCQEEILTHLLYQIVFLMGPKSVGKTTLCLELARNFSGVIYLNLEKDEDRERLTKKDWPNSTELLILDELHKIPRWSRALEELHIKKPVNLKILICVSANLEAFIKQIEWLKNKVYIQQLFPLNLNEAANHFVSYKKEKVLQRLINQGTFPWSFLQGDGDFSRFFLEQYINDLLINEVLEFEKVHDLKAIQKVFNYLRSRIDKPFSFLDVARNFKISPTSAIKYGEILEAFFVIFKVLPFSCGISRSIIKESKIYFFENGLVKSDELSRRRNFLAVILLNYLSRKNLIENEKWELRYLKTKEQRTIDFCLVKNDQIFKLVDIEKEKGKINVDLEYFVDKYNFPAVQLTKEKKSQIKGSIEVKNLDDFLTEP